MYEIAKLLSEEREIVFQNTAAKLGMNAAIIEKDFWVCLTLDYLFHRCKWKQAFAFNKTSSLQLLPNQLHNPVINLQQYLETQKRIFEIAT